MTLDDLRTECDEAERQGLDCTLLVLPHGVSLAGFPRGELLCVNGQKRDRVYRFKIAALRRFIKKAEQ